MMSRWFALRRTSSSNGKSHSKRTSKVCISRKTLVTLSNPIIQPMYCSSIASRNGRLLVRLSILSTDRMAILFLSLNASVPTKIQWFSQLLHSKDFSASCRSPHCPNTSLVSSGLTPNFNLPILPISLCLSPGKLSEFSSCPNTSLVSPGLTPNLSLSRYSQCSSPGKLSEFSLSKHLTCVSRTYSQLQPVEILTIISKTCRLRQSIDKSLPSKMTSQPTCPKVKQNTSSESRILKLFDALGFTSAMYKPSDHVRTLVQAQHRSLQKIRELNTNDSSFTLDGVLSTLQQGSAENGVGSSVELRYHVKKRRAQICGQIQRFIKISTELRRQTRTSTTHTKHKRRA